MTERFSLSPCETQRILRLETGAIDTEHYRRKAVAARRAATSNLIAGLLRTLREAVAPKRPNPPARLVREVM